MHSTIEKKRLAIMKVLQDSNNRAVGSKVITQKLSEMGYNISERTVRFHLLSMDREGYAKYFPKKGRMITKKGISEISKARVYEKVGFLSTKIDQMTYRMRFDLARKKGTVVINTTLISKNDLLHSYPLISRVFDARLGMGTLMALFMPGEELERLTVPEGYIGIGTVCSITINGILLAHGIPTRSRFGGLIEMVENRPIRFVAIINYDGTSLDPLEIFMKSGMTDYKGATANGNGQIGASFREMPEGSRNRVVEISEELDEIGLGCFMKIGYPGKDLCEIPVNDDSLGSVIIGGLNAVAILEESGIKLYSKALSGLVDYTKLFPYTELEERVRSIL